MAEQTLFDMLNESLTTALEDRNNGVPLKTNKVVLKPTEDFSKEDIRKIRLSYKLSQKCFAEVMGVSVKTVESWEQGRNRLTGPSKRLLALMREGKYELPIAAGE